jgi:hypothetical protein
MDERISLLVCLFGVSPFSFFLLLFLLFQIDFTLCNCPVDAAICVCHAVADASRACGCCAGEKVQPYLQSGPRFLVRLPGFSHSSSSHQMSSWRAHWCSLLLPHFPRPPLCACYRNSIVQQDVTAAQWATISALRTKFIIT